MSLLNKALNRQLGKLAAARRELEGVRIREQLACKHENLAEAPYESSRYADCTPPWRICLNCGLTEEGWSYRVLRTQDTLIGVPNINRKDLYKFRLGNTIRDEDKGPLLRRETTLEDLIRRPM